MAVTDISSRYHAILTTRVAIPPTEWPVFENYLRKRNLLRKYPNRQNAPVEIQDWLLADESLPSNTGSEKEDTEGSVDLALQLGLLWPRTYQRTWFGELVADATPGLEVAFKTGSRVHNPYKVSAVQKLYFAWACTKHDGTLLQFLASLFQPDRELDISALQVCFTEQFPDFVRSLAVSDASPQAKAKVRELQSLAQRFARRPVGRKAASGGVTAQTIRRGFEEFVYWRLESLTDIGYLRKRDGALYSYVPTNSMADLAYRMSGGTRPFLESAFFEHVRAILGAINCRRVQRDDALSALNEANAVRHNQMGYTGIEEGVILANSLMLERGDASVLEYKDAVDALGNRPPNARILLSVDRNRRLSAYKIVTL